MFVNQHLAVQVSLGVAQMRLANLADQGGLSSASRSAYQEGLDHVIRVGPVRGVPGTSKLVRVSFLDTVYHDEAMMIIMRWEATGITAVLFPVLDADITLSRAGESATRLELTGSYRPPLGGLGAGLDKAILSKVAAATIRTLLRDIGASLVSPEAAPDHGEATSRGPVLSLATEPIPCDDS